MKTSRISQVSILFGLAVGLMALWAGAVPIGVSGDLVTGGWYSVYQDGYRFACDTSGGCVYCDGGHYDYCSDYTPSGFCTGGLVWVAESGGSQTAYSGGSTNCYHPYYYDLCNSRYTSHASAEHCW